MWRIQFSQDLFFSKSLKVQYFIIGLALALLLAAVGWSVVATFSDNLEILSSSAAAAPTAATKSFDKLKPPAQLLPSTQFKQK